MTEEEELTLRLETPAIPRLAMPELPAETRRRTFDEVELGYDGTAAVLEAKRCLSCGGCSGCRECAKVCEPEAIDFEARDRVVEVKAGTIMGHGLHHL